MADMLRLDLLGPEILVDASWVAALTFTLWFSAKLFDVSFGLLWCFVNFLPNLSNGLVIASRLNVHDEARIVGRANNPPVGESRIGKGE
jgi:hypothetical protein